VRSDKSPEVFLWIQIAAVMEAVEVYLNRHFSFGFCQSGVQYLS